MSKQEKRWNYWANIIAPLLKWPHCTGFLEYLVCDTRTKRGGRLEMVHLEGHSSKQIWKQVYEIIRNRK